MDLFNQPVFQVHRRESSKESESYLDSGRTSFSKNCRLLFNLFMNGETINSNNSPVGDFRRRICDLKENGVHISWNSNGRIKDWFMTHNDKEINKRYLIPRNK